MLNRFFPEAPALRQLPRALLNAAVSELPFWTQTQCRRPTRLFSVGKWAIRLHVREFPKLAMETGRTPLIKGVSRGGRTAVHSSGVAVLTVGVYNRPMF